MSANLIRPDKTLIQSGPIINIFLNGTVLEFTDSAGGVVNINIVNFLGPILAQLDQSVASGTAALSSESSTINPLGVPNEGDVKVDSVSAAIYHSGAWRQVWPSVYGA